MPQMFSEKISVIYEKQGGMAGCTGYSPSLMTWPVKCTEKVACMVLVRMLSAYIFFYSQSKTVYY